MRSAKYIPFLFLIAILAGFVFLLIKEDRFEFVNKDNSENLEIKDKSIKILFVGDVMLGRNVENLMLLNGDEYPFQNINDLLFQNDGVVINLEGPITSFHTHTLSNSLSFSFASTTAGLLASYNIIVASLANNHTYNKGAAGFDETINYLAQNNILAFGNPYEISEKNIGRKRVGDFDLIFVALNFSHPGFDTEKAFKLIRDIEKKPNNFLIALTHGGEEYATSSNSSQQKFYRGIIDSGADVVVAHHPHVVQEIEIYKDKPIFYSLGNFIFDQYFSKDVEEGLAVELELSPIETKYKLIPLKSDHSKIGVMESKSAEEFLSSLANRSGKQIEKSIKNSLIILRKQN